MLPLDDSHVRFEILNSFGGRKHLKEMEHRNFGCILMLTVILRISRRIIMISMCVPMNLTGCFNFLMLCLDIVQLNVLMV